MVMVWSAACAAVERPRPKAMAAMRVRASDMGILLYARHAVRVRDDWIDDLWNERAARRAGRASTAATTLRGRTESVGHPGLQKRCRGGAAPSCPIYGDRRREQRRSSTG